MDNEIADGVRIIRANNPSPFTGTGTNSYLVGQGNVALIDPGPALPEHRDAIMAALENGERISHIFVTHSHLDHSELAPEMAKLTGALVHAFGDSDAGRSAHMSTLGHLGGGEGVDRSFSPDVKITDGQTIQSDHWSLTTHWTPGHFGNHLCFELNDLLFSGDIVMGWSTSLVSPPDGDLTAFMASLEKLKPMKHSRFLPGHGDPVEHPEQRVEELLYHRRMRENQILSHLEKAAADAAALTKIIYTETPKHLHPAAERNVLAHLIDLTQKNMVSHEGELSKATRFRLR